MRLAVLLLLILRLVLVLDDDVVRCGTLHTGNDRKVGQHGGEEWRCDGTGGQLSFRLSTWIVTSNANRETRGRKMLRNRKNDNLLCV